MSVTSVTPIIVSEKLDELREFYVRYFGFEVTVELDTYLGLARGDYELGFLRPEASRIGPYVGEGAFLALRVDDVDAEYERLTGEGVAMLAEPTSNPWGDRSAMCSDPAGVILYLFTPLPA